jgi:hypothetical protein
LFGVHAYRDISATYMRSWELSASPRVVPYLGVNDCPKNFPPEPEEPGDIVGVLDVARYDTVTQQARFQLIADRLDS